MKLKLEKEQRILILILILYLFCVVFYISKFDYNLSAFSELSESNLDLFYGEIPDNLVVFKNSNGYDGQFYYLMAQDFRNNVDGLRNQRVLYPFISKLLSFGNDDLIPFTLIYVNLVAILVGTFFFIKILKLFNSNLNYAYLWAFNPGYILGFMRNLTEPLMIMFILIGIYLILRKKVALSLIFFVLSTLTREASVVIIFSILIFFLAKKEWKNSLYMAVSLVPFLIFNIIIYSVYGNTGFLANSSHTTLPFIGFFNYIKNTDLSLSLKLLIYYLSSVPVFLYALIQGVILIKDKIINLKDRFDIFFYLVVFQVISILILQEFLFKGQICNLGRYGLPLFLFSILYSIRKEKMHWTLILLLIGMSLFLFITKVIRFKISYFIT
ncbi:MAG: hypothetical protein ABIH72_02920 [archaeon]